VKKFFDTIAKVKYVSARMSIYGNLLQIVMLYMVTGWRDIYLIVPILFACIYWFELRHAIGAEVNMGWSRSEDWRKFIGEFRGLQADVAAIKKVTDQVDKE